MNILVYPAKLKGTVAAPSSKSAAHRALICACLSNGTSRLSNIGNNDDIIASISAAEALGAKCYYENEDLIVEGMKHPKEIVTIDCNESGSTLRFFTPIIAALGIKTSFYGKGRLPERPMAPLLDLLEEHGIKREKTNKEIFTLLGSLKSGTYKIPGNISSQYITGLLFALPLLKGDSRILLTTPLESAGYIDMTIDMLSKFGVKIIRLENGYLIAGNQKYQPKSLTIEGDYSSAAFWLSAGALGHEIAVKGLDKYSLQADRGVLSALIQFGANVNIGEDSIAVTSTVLNSAQIDGSGIPDSIPALAVVAAHIKGKTEIYNAQRLKIKESDRLMSTTRGLNNLGVDIAETDDGLIINGGNQLTGGTIESFADHRIAMAMSIAALGSNAPVKIVGAECIAKSYPRFYDDLTLLGGRVDVI